MESFPPLQNADLERDSGYKAEDLKECVNILHDIQLSKRGGSLVSVREKYKQHMVCISYHYSCLVGLDL